MAIDVYFRDEIGNIIQSHYQADEAYKAQLDRELTPLERAFFEGKQAQRVAMAFAFGLVERGKA